MSRVLEVIGPAGAGKSTLASDLARLDGFRMGCHFGARSVTTWPALARNAGFVIGALSPHASRGRSLTWEEVKKTVYLKEWPQRVERERASATAMLVLDQGPVFELARLTAFAPSWLGSGRFASWWPPMYRAWATVLDFVVWLDAPDEVLLGRVRSRRKAHSLKDETIGSAHRKLTAYRSSFETAVRRLQAESDIEVLRFDTSRQTCDAIAKRLESILGLPAA